MKTANTLTAENLKNALWDTLQSVKTKRITPEVANATAGTAREIMRVVKAEIQMTAMAGRKPTQKMLHFSGGQN